jgi:hypothetical protein
MVAPLTTWVLGAIHPTIIVVPFDDATDVLMMSSLPE